LLQNASLTGQRTFTAILQPTSPDKSILEKGASIFPEHGADLICYRGECLAATLYLLPPSIVSVRRTILLHYPGATPMVKQAIDDAASSVRAMTYSIYETLFTTDQ
jgi:hypothetical protein